MALSRTTITVKCPMPYGIDRIFCCQSMHLPTKKIYLLFIQVLTHLVYHIEGRILFL